MKTYLFSIVFLLLFSCEASETKSQSNPNQESKTSITNPGKEEIEKFYGGTCKFYSLSSNRPPYLGVALTIDKLNDEYLGHRDLMLSHIALITFKNLPQADKGKYQEIRVSIEISMSKLLLENTFSINDLQTVQNKMAVVLQVVNLIKKRILMD